MQTATGNRPLTVLGIETSCDETAAAVVADGPDGPRILASVVLDQRALHAAYGGVVPEIAARAHAERVDHAVEAALAQAGTGLAGTGLAGTGLAGTGLAALDAVAVTAGPGLIGGVLAGVMCAKGLALAAGLPLVGVNHLAGHALTPRLTDAVRMPYAMLLVSGGHAQFLRIEAPDRFRRLGGTIDDAPGEAFDKVAKLLGLPQPGGPAVERAAAGGDPARFALPRPLLDRPGLDLSFSGLKTAVLRAAEARAAAQGGLAAQDVADLCAAFQAAVADVLAAKSARLLAQEPGVTAFCVAGGVAANALLRARLMEAAAQAGVAFVAPPLALCTDNGAMIAWAGIERLRLGLTDGWDLPARPRWPLDAGAAPLYGGGRRGAKA